MLNFIIYKKIFKIISIILSVLILIYFIFFIKGDNKQNLKYNIDPTPCPIPTKKAVNQND
jgi:hypothetical protein